MNIISWAIGIVFKFGVLWCLFYALKYMRHNAKDTIRDLFGVLGSKARMWRAKAEAEETQMILDEIEKE